MIKKCENCDWCVYFRDTKNYFCYKQNTLINLDDEKDCWEEQKDDYFNE